MARHGQRIDGLKVARAREALGEGANRVTQAAFAQRIGVHPVTMNRIENSKAKVSLEVLERIAQETGESRDHFLESEEDEEAARVSRDRSLTRDEYALYGELTARIVEAQARKVTA